MDSWDILVDVHHVNDIHVDVHVDGNAVIVDVHDDVHAVHVNAPDGVHHSWIDPESFRFLSLLRAENRYFPMVGVGGGLELVVLSDFKR